MNASMAETGWATAHGVAKSWRRLGDQTTVGPQCFRHLFHHRYSAGSLWRGWAAVLYHQSLLQNKAWKIYQYFCHYLAEN